MSKILKFGINENGRDFVVGDIHGCFTELENQLDKINFNKETDRLFSVGDMVDRGLESERCLEFLGETWFHAVKGNHEQMAIEYFESGSQYDSFSYAFNGGSWFIEKSKEEQKKYADIFNLLPIAIEVETKNGLIGIVHADCPTESWSKLDEALTNEFKDSFENMCLWNRTRIQTRNCMGVKDVFKVYVGHTPVNTVTAFSNVYCIDTGAVFKGGKLTILQIN